MSHLGDGQQVAILEKAMRISEDVIRYLTVKQEGPLPTPKASSSSDEKKDKKDEDKNKAEDKKDEEIKSESISESKNIDENKNENSAS